MKVEAFCRANVRCPLDHRRGHKRSRRVAEIEQMSTALGKDDQIRKAYLLFLQNCLSLGSPGENLVQKIEAHIGYPRLMIPRVSVVGFTLRNVQPRGNARLCERLVKRL